MGFTLALFAFISATVLIGVRSRRGWAQFGVSTLILCGGLWLLERVDGMGYVIVPLAAWAAWAGFGPAGWQRDWQRIHAGTR
jgi:hypothetical protein